MLLRRIWHGITTRLGRPERRTPPRAHRARPLLEVLEDRLVPTNFFVSTLGSDANIGSTAAPFRTIQHAINAAQSGDRIHVAGGVYGYDGSQDQLSGFLQVNPAAVMIFDKSLTILGGFDNAFTTWAPTTFRTFIDGGSALRGVYVLAANTDVSLDMEGFTVEAGLAQGEPRLTGQDQTFAFGGGMWINTAARNGSGTPGSFVLRNMTFRGNRAVGSNTGGSGGSAAGAALELRFVSNVTLDHVTFDTNLSQGGTGTTKGGDALGGGIHLDHSNVSGSNVTFINNRAVAGASSGSGRDAAGTTADALGAGAAVQINSSLTLQNVFALNNSLVGGNAANGQAGSAFGGAFFAEVGTLNLGNANIRNNIIQGGSGQNGGLAGGGGVEILNSNLSLNQVQVINNTVLGGNGAGNAGSPGGGGLYLTRLGSTAATTVSLLNTVVADNTVGFAGGGSRAVGGGGGGLWLQGVAANLTHTTIANNHFDPNLVFGQAILLLNDGASTPTTATIADSIIANHTSANGASALDVRNQSGQNVVTLNHVLYANNTKDDNSNGQPDPAGVFNGLNTVIRAASAGFVAPGPVNFDYSITANSPAVNQAVGSGVTVDINNNPRTGTPDLGAYEAPPAPLARDSVALFDPESGIWELRNRNAGGFFPDGPVFAYGSGGGISRPVLGDWDGNGTDTVGVVEANPDGTTTWKLRNTNGPGGADIVVTYGGANSIPVVGKWTGGSVDHIGIVEFAGGVATWKLRNSFTAGAPDIQVAYGGANSIPVVGDWDGNGTDTMGIVEFGGGVATWKLRNSFTAGAPDAGNFSYGGAGWEPITGDWNGDGIETPGMFNPANAAWFLRNENFAGPPDAGQFIFGEPNWIARSGNFDGLG
jgi:hypothetical protein